MRRVVADQIKALNELTALVSRAGRGVDASAPPPPRRAPEAPAAAPVAATATPEARPAAPPPSAPPRLTGQDFARPPQAPSAPAPVAPRATPPATPATPALTRTPEPRRELRDPAPARRDEPPAPREGGGSGGWLSDLLIRASRDEDELPRPAPASSPRPERARTLDSLETISVDISRMIDHEAAVDLWERHRRGERNVVSRRLYTPQGQQTFEEIRRKYRRDADFKQTVDRYIEEFDRLLAEVARDDRDSVLANTYLTSETGKVYTMLAHASGRLE
jgi:hypothetical protein